jgi:ankyrin repeat protein
MKNITPYPKPIEIIRFIALAFDLKNSKKSLDDKAFDAHTNTQEIDRQINELIEKIPYQNLKSYLQKYLLIHIKKYLKDLAGQLPATGISSIGFRKILTEEKLKLFVYHLLNGFTKDIEPQLDLYSLDENSVNIAFNWIAKKYPDFKNQYKQEKKEKKDKLSLWINAKHLPSNQSIFLLKNNDKSIDWDELQSVLLLARAIDFFKQKSQELLSAPDKPLYIQPLELVKNIENELKINKDKKSINPSSILKNINDARYLVIKTDMQDEFNFLIDFYEARWNIFSGNILEALPLYKKAFEECLYRAGSLQEQIIKETLAVFSYQDKPDKVLLKKLKTSLITFGYDVPISREKQTAKFEDVMQNWEIDYYKKEFTKIFCIENLFVGVESYEAKSTKLGPILYTEGEIKPDYRYPNRKIKQKHMHGGEKITPQIIYFASIGNIENVKKLLKKGADVNVKSSSNETIISMALEGMSIFKPTSPKSKLFNLISKCNYKKDTLNVKTNKKKFLPIISAVDTGRPEVVKKILKMGANPNKLGTTDEQVALNFVLKYIKLVKSPDLEKELKSQLPSNKIPSTEAQDSMLRHTGGLGLANGDKDFDNMVNILVKIQIENINKYLTLDNLYKIADLLLEFKADPNAENFYPIHGYTPLMLAAELNEYELFEKMLKYGGDIRKTFTNPHNGEKFDCLDIAERYKSTDVIEIIKKLN